MLPPLLMMNRMPVTSVVRVLWEMHQTLTAPLPLPQIWHTHYHHYHHHHHHHWLLRGERREGMRMPFQVVVSCCEESECPVQVYWWW
jgi:hypothetical protein